MIFFVPGISELREARRDYLETANQLKRNGFAVTSREIFLLEYEHNDEVVLAEVGQKHPSNDELVLAIFELEGGSFAVCTTSRGWDLEHLPIFTGSNGRDRVIRIEDFK